MSQVNWSGGGVQFYVVTRRLRYIWAAIVVVEVEGTRTLVIACDMVTSNYYWYY